MQREIRLHIGAHKTATTHFQDIMELNQAFFAERGVTYVPRKAFRRSIAGALSRRNWRVWVGGGVLGRQIEWQLAPHIEDGTRVVISDENILGRPADALAPTF